MDKLLLPQLNTSLTPKVSKMEIPPQTEVGNFMLSICRTNCSVSITVVVVVVGGGGGTFELQYLGGR